MRPNSVAATTSLGALAVAALAFVCVYALGAYVGARTPTRLDVEASALRGGAITLASFFTLLGRWYAVSIVGIAAMLYSGSRRGAFAIAALLLSQLISQGVIDLVKGYFHRTRPDDWLVTHELGFSYPSGHAATSIAFYAALLVLVLRVHPQSRALDAIVAVALAVSILGIPWSRLALGAHYATDVIGGIVFGIGWLALIIAAVTGYAALRGQQLAI